VKELQLDTRRYLVPNENTSYQNGSDASKTIIKGKLIAPVVEKRKLSNQ
jgi:hypothetical protein